MLIDTHQHILPPFYAEWLKGCKQPMHVPAPEWATKRALNIMDQNFIDSAILSVVPMMIAAAGDAPMMVGMARRLNEYSADIVSKHPRRFGFFATLTLPDIEHAICEARYALDVLHADGIILPSYAGTALIGDAAWRPLMDYLNQRATVVLVHPVALPALEMHSRSHYAPEFLFDMTQAGMNIAKSGWLEQYPDIKFILAHGGGFLPFVAKQKAHIMSPDHSQTQGVERLRRFYFDTALTNQPNLLPTLLAFADPTHITFGSDWPLVPHHYSPHLAQSLDDISSSREQRNAITHRNALRLFPRLHKSICFFEW
jgi:predicted TIM-barrel fold metal-dependent hydrolase